MPSPSARPLALCALIGVFLLTGCAVPKAYDHSALKQAKPRSILVLPPINESLDVKATHSMLSQSSKPLAESGYYVLPVALVEETFRQNGLTQADDIHAVDLRKLHSIFGADAVLYIKVKRYGATYFVVGSATVVEAEARLLDARSGALLWEGTASASSEERRSSSSGGITSLLISAVIQQVVSSVTDQSHAVAGIASHRLLSARAGDGLLPGPRHPEYAGAKP